MRLAQLCFTAISVIGSVLLLSAGTARAGTVYYWFGSDTVLGGAGTWNSTSLYWSNNSDTLSGVAWPNTTAYDAYFGGASGGAVTISGGTITAGGMSIATSGYTLSGGTIALGSGGITASYASSVATVGGTVSLKANQTWSVAGGSLTASAYVFGASTINLTKTGPGTLVVSGGTSGNFTGTLTIAEGAVQFGSGVSSSSAGIMDCTNIVDNGELVFNRNNNGSSSPTYTISGTGAVTQRGSRAIYLYKNNTYTGLTTIMAGRTLGIGNVTPSSTGAITSDVANSGLLVFSRSNAYSYDNVISGTGSVSKVGAGVLTLSQTHSYTGTTTVSAGTLRVTGSIATSSSVSIAAGAALTGSGTATTVGVASGGIIGSLDDSSVWGGNWSFGTLTLAGDSIFNFGNINAYATNGAIAVTGTDTFSSVGTITVNLAGTVPIGSAGVSHLIQYAGTPLSLSYTLGAVSFANVRSSIALSTSTSGGLNYLDVSYLVDQVYWSGLGDSVWTTDTATTPNWKLVSNDSMVDYIQGDAVIFDNRVGSSSTVTVGMEVTPASVTFNNGAAISYTLAGDYGISGSTSLTLNGAGMVRVQNANSYTGGTNLNAGTLILENADAIGDTGTIAFGGGTLTFTSANTADYSARFSNAAGQQYNIDTNGQNVTFAASLTSSGGNLTKLGAGTLTMTGSNSLSGTVTISDGAIQLGDGVGNTGYFSNSLVVDNAELVFNRVSAGYNFQPTYTISGTGSVKKLGSTTWDILRANTYSGGTTLVEGRIRFSAPSPTDTVLGSGTLTILGGSSITTTTSAVLANAIVVGDGANGFVRNSNSVTFNGNITGGSSGTLSIIPTSTVRLGGDNSGFAGTFVLDCTGGSIYFSSADAGSGNARFVTSYTSGSSYIRSEAGSNTTIKMGELSGNGRLRNSNSGDNEPVTFEVGRLNTDAEFSGVIVDGSNAGAQTNFTKVGTGKLTLSGANTYTGTTTVNDGTLSVNGSLASPVNVIAGVLGGSGTIANAVTVGAATLAPGNSPATLTIAGALSLGSGASLSFELNGADTTVGGGINDLIQSVTTLTLDGTLNVTETVADSFLSAHVGDRWTLITYTPGQLTDNGLDLGMTPALSGGSFAVDTTIVGQVDLVVVPEPGTLVLLAAGLTALFAYAWRKRK
jgi:autotransporter-associated beta strand protein